MIESWRVTSAKSIVYLAAEQEALAQKARKAAWRRALFILFFLLQVIGWCFVRSGTTPYGAALVLLGLVGWLFCGGLGEAFQGKLRSWVAAIAVGGASASLYMSFRSQTFQWGPDVSFYRAVLENHVPSPFSSPLSYLIDQAFLPLLRGFWPDLPAVTAITFGFAMGILALFLLEGARRSRETKLFTLAAVLAVAVSLPVALFSGRALGLTSALGLILGLILNRLLDVRERPNRAAFLLAGLMASLHPFWGLLGIVLLWRRPDETFRRVPKAAWMYLAGLTPYLWVYFHAGRTLGGWGGEHPFSALLYGWHEWWIFQNNTGFSGLTDQELLGVSLAAFAGALFLIGWKTTGITSRLLQTAVAGAGAFLFASKTGGVPGSTAVWLPALAAGWWTALYHEAKSGAGYGSQFQRVVAWMSVLAAIFLAFLPMELTSRILTAAPQQHAENLLACVQNNGKPVLLLSEDLFEVDALSLLQMRTGHAENLVVVAAPYLGDRWYLSELIRLKPEVLIATSSGSRETLFNDLVRRNIGHWDVEWSIPEVSPIPSVAPEHSGFQTVPRVLTQRLVGLQEKILGDDPTSRCDLSDLMEEARRKDGPARIALSRYAVGLQSWAVSQSRAGHYPEALRGFERALSIDPTYDAPRQALERLYNEKSMADAARLQFEKTARVLTPKLQALEQTLAKTKPEAQTALLAQKAQWTEELVDALHHLGVIYDHEGRLEDSRRALEQVLQFKPSRAETQLALAQLFLKVGNRTQAQAAFKAVLQVDPENKEAQAELWKLINKP